MLVAVHLGTAIAMVEEEEEEEVGVDMVVVVVVVVEEVDDIEGKVDCHE